MHILIIQGNGSEVHIHTHTLSHAHIYLFSCLSPYLLCRRLNANNSIFHATCCAHCRETILAKEMSKGGDTFTVSDLRLLKPLGNELIISIVYGMRFVENDFSCNGLYRAKGTRSKRKPSKLNSLLESGKRVSVADFRSIVGQNGIAVAGAVTDLLYCYAPLISYKLYDEILMCKNVDDLQAFFDKNAPPHGGAIPQASYDFLCAFCIHLFDLCKFKDRNGMDIDQLR